MRGIGVALLLKPDVEQASTRSSYRNGELIDQSTSHSGWSKSGDFDFSRGFSLWDQLPGEDRLTALVRGHPAVAFPVLYLGWAYLFWIPLIASQHAVWEFPGILWFLAGGASPLLAGILRAALDGGTRHVLDILRRSTDRRRIGGRSWLLLLSFWLLFDLAMAGLVILLGISQSPINPDWGLFREPRALLFLLLLSFVFPAVEEIGLRGYYLEALQRKWPPTAAGIVNGIVWAMWHAPFVWFAGYYASTSFNPALSWWLPMIVWRMRAETD